MNCYQINYLVIPPEKNNLQFVGLLSLSISTNENIVDITKYINKEMRDIFAPNKVILLTFRRIKEVEK